MDEKETIIFKNLVLEKNKEINIGILTDIHGNEQAFLKALDILKDCDMLINLGDLPGIGPNSKEVYDIYKKVSKEREFYSVLGNHERYLLFGFNNPLSCLTFEQQDFTEHQIDEDTIKLIEKFPLEINIKWNDMTITFLHYARRVYDGVRFKLIDHNPTLKSLNDLFEFHDSDFLLYGHEHVGSIIEGKINGKVRHFINPGSCGCPHPVKNTGVCGILHLNKEIKYEQIEFTYDASSVVRDMINKNMPNKELIIHDFYKEDINKYEA